MGEGLSLGGVALKKLKPYLKHHYLLNCKKIERYKNAKNRRLQVSSDPKVVDKRDFWGLKEEDPVFNFLKDINFEMKFKPKLTIDNNYKVAHIKIPRNFDLITNTDESIETIRKIFYCGSLNTIDGLHLNQVACQKMSLCASSIMSAIVLAIDRKNEVEDKKFQISGSLSNCKTDEVFEMMHASGLLKILDFDSNEDYREAISAPEFKLIEVLDLLTPKDTKLFSSKKRIYSESADVASNITNYLNRCLSTQKLELNNKGKRVIGNMIGETINNCTLHTGLNFENWFCAGYSKYIEPYTKCSLVIFNFGNTIYEGLKNNSIDSDTPKTISEIARSMSGYKKRTFSDENLWTLLALQDGVSRCYNQNEGKDRGTGTIKLIQTFQSLGKTCDGKNPIMTIISGNTKIIFDDKYKIKEENIKGSNRDIIAFNRENSLKYLPDKQNVKGLKNKFPGTIISLEFYLDNKYLGSQ